MFDPFDLDRGIAERGRDAFYEVAAFGYPEHRSPATFVVLLDDAFLKSSNGSWPPSYQVHANAIESIAQHRPRAIVVDLLFLDKRDTDSLDVLVQTIRREADRAPIYLASPPLDLFGTYAQPEIVDLVNNSDGRVQFVSVGAGRDIGAGSTYPLRSEATNLRTAAVALYEDLCPIPHACDLKGSSEEEMDIWWAVPRRDKFNCRGEELKRLCSILPNDVWSRLLWNSKGLFNGVLPLAWQTPETVPLQYSPTVGIGELFDPAYASTLKERIQGAVVFYGANLAFVSDSEDTPAQGRVASVHAHAMAYDNLHALSGNYVRASPPFGSDGKLHNILLSALLILAALLVRVTLTMTGTIPTARPHRRDRLFGVLDATTFLVTALAIATFEFYVLRIGPYAWAPVLAAVAAGDLLSNRTIAGSAIVRLLRRRQSPPISAAAVPPLHAAVDPKAAHAQEGRE